MSAWGKMRGFFLSEEELGKKDDDHKPFKNGTGLRQPNWHPARVTPRRSLKRIAIALVVTVVIYLFIKNIPDLGPNAQMRRPSYTYLEDLDAAIPKRPSYERSKSPPTKPNTRLPNTPERDFNGPVKFLELAQTLHAIGGTRGTMAMNRNVLFATSSLKSAATLLPIACQMGLELQNYVHFALMSRSDIDIRDLRKLNGIDDSCHIIFHGMIHVKVKMTWAPTNLIIRCAYRLCSGIDRRSNGKCGISSVTYVVFLPWNRRICLCLF